MVEESATTITRNVVTADRTAAILSLSDKENAYCLPAAFVQLAAASNDTYLPPRLEQFKMDVVENHLSQPDGKVSPQQLIETISKITQHLNIRVVKIVGRAEFFDEIARPSTEPKTHTIKTHAECCDGTSLSKRRLKELNEAGWFNVAAVICQPNHNSQTTNDVSELIEYKTGFIPLEEPYVLLLGKRVKKD